MASTGFCQTFQNPIDQTESADPFITRYNGFYYYLRTTGDIRIQRSPNLQDVGSAPETVVFSPNPNGPIRSDIWAPELYHFDGHWYIYSCGNVAGGLQGPQQMFVLESVCDDPMGPYNYRGILLPGVPSIDETVLVRDSDGARFLVWSQWDGAEQCIYIGPLTNPWTLGQPRVKLSSPTYGWERIGGPVNEGPITLKHNGKAHIIYSASGTWTPDYCLGRLTNSSGDYLNPAAWSKSSVPVFQRSDQNGVWCVGHNGFTQSPDGTEDWIIYHATSNPNGNQQPLRNARMQRFTWNADDTPNFGVPLPLNQVIALPSVSGSSPNLVSGHTYIIRARNSGKCAEVGGGSLANGGNVNLFQVWSPSATCQRWTAYDQGGGYWKFINVNSGQALEVAAMATNPGGNIAQWPSNGFPCQQWRLASAGGGYWKVINRNSGLLMDVEGGPGATANGTNISQYYDINGGNQQWSFEETSPLYNGWNYSFISVNSNKVAEVAGGNINPGANVQQWDWLNYNWQKWTAYELGGGFVRLVNLNGGKTLEVSGVSFLPGANIQVWDWLGNYGQQWRLEGIDGSNVYRLVNRSSGQVMDVDGFGTANGTNISQFPWFGSNNQKWFVDRR